MFKGISMPRSWRLRLPRFSLLTLILVVVFVSACGGLWYRWEPWGVVRVLTHDSGTASFCSDASRVVTHEGLLDLAVWDTATGKRVGGAKVDEENGAAQITHLLGPNRIYAGNRKCVRIWDVASGKRIALICVPPGPADRNVGYMPPFQLVRKSIECVDQRVLAVWLEPGYVGFWDIETGQHQGWLDGQATFQRIAVSIRRDRLTALRSDGQVAVYAVPERKCIAIWSKPALELEHLCHSPKNPQVFIAAQSAPKLIWNYEAQTEIPLGASAGPCAEADFSPDGERLVTQEEGFVFKLWDTRTGALLASEVGSGQHGLSYLSNERFMSIVNQGGPDDVYHYRLWDGRTGDRVGDLDLGDTAYIGAMCCVMSDQRLLLTSARRTAIYDTRDGSLLWQIADNAGCEVLDYSESLDQLLVCRNSSSIEVWSRRRPETRWGFVSLPEFWLVVLSAIALAGVAVRNRRQVSRWGHRVIR